MVHIYSGAAGSSIDALAFDPSLGLVFAERTATSNYVYSLSTSGIKATLAGKASVISGGDGVSTTIAGFSPISAIVVDPPTNDVIVAESNRIRRIYAASKTVSTIAGNGTTGCGIGATGRTSSLASISGLAWEQGSGRLLVTSSGCSSAYWLTGTSLSLIVSKDTDSRVQAPRSPAWAAADRSIIAMADPKTGLAYVVNLTSGLVTTKLTFTNYSSSDGSLRGPTDIAVDMSDGAYFFSDPETPSIREAGVPGVLDSRVVAGDARLSPGAMPLPAAGSAPASELLGSTNYSITPSGLLAHPSGSLLFFVDSGAVPAIRALMCARPATGGKLWDIYANRFVPVPLGSFVADFSLAVNAFGSNRGQGAGQCLKEAFYCPGGTNSPVSVPQGFYTLAPSPFKNISSCNGTLSGPTCITISGGGGHAGILLIGKVLLSMLVFPVTASRPLPVGMLLVSPASSTPTTADLLLCDLSRLASAGSIAAYDSTVCRLVAANVYTATTFLLLGPIRTPVAMGAVLCVNDLLVAFELEVAGRGDNLQDYSAVPTVNSFSTYVSAAGSGTVNWNYLPGPILEPHPSLNFFYLHFATKDRLSSAIYICTAPGFDSTWDQCFQTKDTVMGVVMAAAFSLEPTLTDGTGYLVVSTASGSLFQLTLNAGNTVVGSLQALTNPLKSPALFSFWPSVPSSLALFNGSSVAIVDALRPSSTSLLLPLNPRREVRYLGWTGLVWFL
jgi:hypothetical protein